MGRGVVLYIKEYNQDYEIKLKRCNIVTGNSTLTIGLVYRNPNINGDDKTKIQICRK